MKALVWLDPARKAVAERAKPTIVAPGDAIVRVTKASLCGTDLDFPRGHLPRCTPGRIPGHEGAGVVEAVGAAVTAFRPGDRVLVSCVTACGNCHYCRRQKFSHCLQGGWILGNTIDGTQAEFVRVPWADTSLYPATEAVDERGLVPLGDIMMMPRWQATTTSP